MPRKVSRIMQGSVWLINPVYGMVHHLMGKFAKYLCNA